MAGQVILIVDDNANNRKLTRDVLEFSGFGTLEATGGIEGVALAQEHLPDLVLMDIRMPDLSGNEALKLLREDSRTAELPIVALTSSTMRDEKRFLTQGFDGYLPKPIRVREFPDQVRSYLRA